jgi:hypothetical protein
VPQQPPSAKQTAPAHTVYKPSCSSARTIINHSIGARDGVVGHGEHAAAPVTSNPRAAAAASLTQCTLAPALRAQGGHGEWAVISLRFPS